MDSLSAWVLQSYIEQEQQRIDIEPENAQSFIFARCRPTQARRGAAGAGAAAAAAGAALTAAVYRQFDD